jgi:septal ring factor EnvC (AmiA/AmiB activator)
MAGKKKNAAASAAPEPVPESDGPVLIVLKKRLRAANKKLRKIEDVEAAVVAGKEINEEQRLLLTGKPGLQAVIDELEKLSTLLCQALGDEATVHQQHGYEKAMAEVKQQEAERHAKEAMEAAAAEAAKAADKAEAEENEKHDKGTVTEPKEPEKPDHTPVVEKLLQLLYFAQVGQCCCWELQKQYSAAI